MRHRCLTGIHRTSRLVERFSAADFGSTCFSHTTIKLLVPFLELHFGILDRLRQLLNRSCYSRLQPRFEEEEEGYEDENVEEEQDELEPEQIVVDELFEVVLDGHV